MRIIGNDPSVPRQTQEVASGTLPCGKPVVVNADGTVTDASGSALALANGTPVEYGDANTAHQSATFDSNSNKVVVAFRGTSDHGKAVVGTVNGTDNSISFGTVVTFEAASQLNNAITFDSSNNKVVIAYRDEGNSNYGTAIVGTVSGTDISFGSPAVFNTGRSDSISIAFDSSNNKVVIAYRDNGNSNYGTAIVGTVSGTGISFGSEVVFKSATTGVTSAVFDSNSNKVAILYNDGAGKAVVGTVSGTGISFGSEATFESGAVDGLSTSFDSNLNKIVAAYRDEGNSNYGTSAIGTISGTDITFGTPVVFEAAGMLYTGTAFDTGVNKVNIFYKDGGNSDYGTVIVGTISGTTISFGTPVVYENAQTGGFAATFDSNSRRVIGVYTDAGNSTKGTAVVVRNAGTYPNLTSENYIGMSSGTAFQTGEAGSTGTAVSFESGLTELSHAAFDSSNNKVVIAYVDGDDTNKGKAVVATVSGTSISFGSIVTYEAGNTANIDCVFDSSNNKIVIVYSDAGDSGRSKGIVGTVSGTSISFGSPTQFNSGANYAYDVAAAFDSSNNKVVVAYRDNGNSSYGTAVVGTVSGTSISFGTPVVYESANSQQNAVVFDSSNNKVVIAYKDAGNSDHGTAIVGTVSGTSISYGSAVVFNAGETSQIVGAFDSSNNKVVLAFRDNGNSDQGTAIVGTVSGTSISFGSEVIFNAANTQGTSAVFDSNVNKVVISYEDRGDSDIGKFIVGTVSGTSISFDTETAFSGSNAVFQTGAAFDSNANKIVIAYANDTDSGNRGEGIVTSLSTIATTRGQVADGGHALVDTQGAISDNQIGLTAGQSYYVQNDGTLGTTAADPSVFAGTAVSATKLIVKG